MHRLETKFSTNITPSKIENSPVLLKLMFDFVAKSMFMHTCPLFFQKCAVRNVESCAETNSKRVRQIKFAWCDTVVIFISVVLLRL